MEDGPTLQQELQNLHVSVLAGHMQWSKPISIERYRAHIIFRLALQLDDLQVYEYRKVANGLIDMPFSRNCPSEVSMIFLQVLNLP